MVILPAATAVPLPWWVKAAVVMGVIVMWVASPAWVARRIQHKELIALPPVNATRAESTELARIAKLARIEDSREPRGPRTGRGLFWVYAALIVIGAALGGIAAEVVDGDDRPTNGGQQAGPSATPTTDDPEPTDTPTPSPSPTYPIAPDVTGLTFLQASRTLEFVDIAFEEVAIRDPEAEYGEVLAQSVPAGDPVPDVLELTVARRRPPVGDALESALVKDHERARIPEYISEDDQRNDLLTAIDPSGAYICDNEIASSQEIADDTFRGWDAVLNGFQLASEVTSFYEDGAELFMRDVRRHARNCEGAGLRLVPTRKPAESDEILHLVYSGDGEQGLILYSGTPQVDWVLVRKDNVLVQVAIMVGYGGQSQDAVELATLGASRIR